LFVISGLLSPSHVTEPFNQIKFKKLNFKFEFLTAVLMQVQVFWCIFLWWTADSYWRLGGFSAVIFRDDDIVRHRRL